MLVNENQADTAEGFRVHLDDADIATLMHALLKSERRVQKVELSQLTVWIKRQGTETPSWWIKLQTFLAKLLPYTFMRPSPPLDGAGLMRRELDTLQAFKASGFPVPPVIYSSRTAVVLGDVGPTIIERMDAIKTAAPAEHDALLVKSAEALGELHAAGLCHGRPHVRDFFSKTAALVSWILRSARRKSCRSRRRRPAMSGCCFYRSRPAPAMRGKPAMPPLPAGAKRPAPGAGRIVPSDRHSGAFFTGCPVDRARADG